MHGTRCDRLSGGGTWEEERVWAYGCGDGVGVDGFSDQADQQSVEWRWYPDGDATSVEVDHVIAADDHINAELHQPGHVNAEQQQQSSGYP
ncbi:hypothetical protein ACFP2T_35270 [Plantactinospora solaniradicis]|uniref:Uncharacterized protein n=1 Tax=Plantactinospora solaniradicis TaxID=1723736 RepID=A0ABW1KKM7_9ACTN